MVPHSGSSTASLTHSQPHVDPTQAHIKHPINLLLCTPNTQLMCYYAHQAPCINMLFCPPPGQHPLGLALCRLRLSCQQPRLTYPHLLHLGGQGLGAILTIRQSPPSAPQLLRMPRSFSLRLTGGGGGRGQQQQQQQRLSVGRAQRDQSSSGEGLCEQHHSLELSIRSGDSSPHHEAMGKAARSKKQGRLGPLSEDTCVSCRRGRF